MTDMFVVLIYVGGCAGAEAAGWSTWQCLTWPYRIARVLVARTIAEATKG